MTIKNSYSQKSPKDQIEEVITKVKQSQEKVASYLTWITLSRFAIMSDDKIAKINEDFKSYLSPTRENSWFLKEEDSLFQLYYGDAKSLDETERAAIQHLSNIRKLKKYWIHNGVELQESQKRTVELFKDRQDICGMNYFQNSLNSLSFIPSLDLNTKNLGEVYQFDISAGGFSNENGEALPYLEISSSYNRSKNENEAMNAVIYGSGAIATSYGGPLAGAATMAVLSFTVAMVDMNKNLRELQEIADKNWELFEAKKFEVNVFQYYQKKCVALKKSYEEVYDLTQKMTVDELGSYYIDYKGSISETDLKDWEKSFESDSEVFYLYSKFIILNSLVNFKTSFNLYTESWDRVIAQFDQLYEQTKDAIYGLIEQKYRTSHSLNVLFNEVEQILKATENFTDFKSSFYDTVLKFFNTIDKNERKSITENLRKQIYSFNYQFPNQGMEEIETIQNFEEIVSKLEIQNE